LNEHALVPGNRQLSATSGVVVPTVIQDAGPDAIRRFVEFFTANIRNPNTRAAYMRAVRRFCGWAKQHKVSLAQMQPVLVAAYVEELQREYSDLSVKQHLAAIRMLFDYLVTGGVLQVNPAAAVKGPKVVIRKGKTPILSATEARLLLDSIDTSTIVGLRDRAIIALMVHTFARIGAALKRHARRLSVGVFALYAILSLIVFQISGPGDLAMILFRSGLAELTTPQITERRWVARNRPAVNPTSLSPKGKVMESQSTTRWSTWRKSSANARRPACWSGRLRTRSLGSPSRLAGRHSGTRPPVLERAKPCRLRRLK